MKCKDMRKASALCIGLLVGVAFSQSLPVGAGGLRITGKVIDPAGYPVPQTDVIIKSPGLASVTAQSKTDANGIFTFDGGLKHQYEFEFRKPGFKILRKTYEVAGNSLQIGSITLEIDWPGNPDLPVPPDYGPLKPIPSVASTVLKPISGGRRIRGRYSNVDYGFRVDVPDGFTGEGSIPPAPNHGFTIPFAEDSAVWIDATYEMRDSPHVFLRFNARLGRLKAERRHWSDPESGNKLRHESIVAQGFDRHTPIIYTIQLDATADHWPDGIRLLDAVVRSFQTIPVRP
jgi:hypothetical protein